jgi:hypothetical protein
MHSDSLCEVDDVQLLFESMRSLIYYLPVSLERGVFFTPPATYRPDILADEKFRHLKINLA